MKVFSLFHSVSKNRRTETYNPEVNNPEHWPDSWKTTYYKTYPRFETIALSAPAHIETQLSAAIRGRHSTRQYDVRVTEPALSQLLFYSVGEIDHEALSGRGRRACASAGARFPIETYILLLKDVGAIPAGIYHYAVEVHGLTQLAKKQLSQDILNTMFRQAETQSATAIIFLAGVFAREVDKYGERGYRNVLIEAGAIGQQMYVLASALALGCVAMSGIEDEVIERMLGIDGFTESVVHTIVIG